MTFTLHISSWIIPLFFTILSLIVFLYVRFSERNNGGFFSGIASLLTFILGAGITIASWLVWGLTYYFTKQ